MRNIILIITSTIICIGIGAYFLFFFSPKSWDIAYRTTSMTGADTYSTKKTEIERLSTQDANRANMAIRESNSDLCTTISTVGQQAECRDKISIAVAQKK